MTEHPGRDHRTTSPRAVLALLGVAFLVAVLDSTSVVAALPAIQEGLGFTTGGVAWVATAYGVAVGGFLLTAGRASDVIGARRTFAGATALFLLASVACGLAPTSGALVGARVVQGLAAAALTPSALALLLAAHPEGPARNRALAVWGGLGGVGATAGLLVGGLLTTTLGWEWIFFVNVPVCLVVLVLTPVLLPAPPAQPGRRPDVLGALSLSVALAAAVLVLLRGPESGWAEPVTVAGGALAVAAGTAFWWTERRTTEPMLPPRLFAVRGLRRGNLLVLVSGIAVDALLLLTTRHAQGPMGASALGFGALAAVMTVASVGGVAAGQSLVTRWGARTTAVAGTALMVVAGVVLTQVPDRGWAVPVVGMALFGPGMGLTFVAGQIAALAGVPESDSGVASGLEETSFGVGGTLGTALGSSAVVVLGTAAGFGVVAALGLLGVLVASLLPRSQGAVAA